jgi:hypothetical protein
MEQFRASMDARLDDNTVMLTLSATAWLLNVHAGPTEWQQSLPRVPDADHARRSDVKLGDVRGDAGLVERRRRSTHVERG